MRIGIVLADMKSANTVALKFLVLKLNAVQSRFQYEFLPTPSHELVSLLGPRRLVERDRRIRPMAREFVAAFKEGLQQSYASGSGMAQRDLPDYIVLISLASFTDGYYTMREGPLSVLALGTWERHMAPPSLAEFILVLLVRETVAASCLTLRGSVHMGTRGCIMDFTPSLDEVRVKVLAGQLCQDCRASMSAAGGIEMVEDVERMLRREWIGKPDDPSSPATLMSKLGYDLFTTKGLAATGWEKTKATLREEGIKEILKLLFAVVLAVVVLWLGLKK